MGGSEKGVYIVCADSKVMRDRGLCVHIQRKKRGGVKAMKHDKKG